MDNQKSIPIVLGIARFAGNAQPLTEARAQLDAELKQKVFERDGYVCRCCGFKSQKYQDTLFLNGRTDDLRLENMATTCIFCHQCFNLEQVTLMRSGVLVW
ncbi:MAG: type IV secretion protein DotN, partial [Alphaproteobacteria bacterium]|nr:type IV secretion protein DotN [Alphaproteobacteria bacterium]